MKGICVYQPGTPKKDLSACAYNVHANIDNFFFIIIICFAQTPQVTLTVAEKHRKYWLIRQAFEI